MNTRTKTGIKIRNSFETPFDEMKSIRKAVALLMANIDYNLLTTEEKLIYDQFQEYNMKVNNIIGGYEKSLM